MRSTPCLMLAVAALATGLAAQSVSPQLQIPSPLLPAHTQPVRCLTPARGIGPGSPMDHPDCDQTQTNPSAAYAPTFLYRIPVVVHVIASSSGQGNLSNTLVQSQITVLNEDFRAMAGTPGAAGVDTMIEFFLATTDPNGQPTTGIVRHTNNTWYQDNGSYWNSIAWNTSRYLNIYTNDVGNGGILGYVPGLPQGGQTLGTNADRVVIHWSVFGRPGLGGAPYNGGRTCTHEVAHYLGLYHTFDGGCGSTTACLTTGDLICDTNPEQAPRYGCPLAAVSCGSVDPVRNYMDYTDDLCMNHFTAQQARRMRCTIQRYRSNLAIVGNCATATAVIRNAGANLNQHQAIPLRIGQPWNGSVVLFGTGYQFAALYGFTGQANVPFGQWRVLIDLQSPIVFQLPFTGNGFAASWAFTVPNDVNLCGLPVTTQALVFGGLPDFGLTNAMDMVVGI